MTRRSSIATSAILRHAAKHASLEKFLAQGRRRAMTRSGRAGIDAKVRAINAAFNLSHPDYAGINKKKRFFSLRVTSPETAREIVRAPAGVPLKYYGALGTPKGLVFMIRRGRRSILRSGFTVESLGRHGFTRDGAIRLPISKRFGPGLPTLADDRVVRARGAGAYQDRIQSEVMKEENRAFRRAKL